MTFQHPDLEQFYERVMALKVGGLADMERPVFALMDAYGWFRLIDGDQTAKIQEIISHLLSPELRPALRSWHGRHDRADTNSGFNELRDHLSKLAGEKFE
jgi:hypothetical protein